METPSQTLWEIVEALLEGGREPLARAAFGWAAEYAFLCGLKDAPVPVVLTKLASRDGPSRLHLRKDITEAWGRGLVGYMARDWPLARRRAVEQLDGYYYYAQALAQQESRDCDQEVWSINTWR